MDRTPGQVDHAGKSTWQEKEEAPVVHCTTSASCIAAAKELTHGIHYLFDVLPIQQRIVLW